MAHKAVHELLQFSAQHVKLKIGFQFTITHQAEDHHRDKAGTGVAISMMEADEPWAWVGKDTLK